MGGGAGCSAVSSRWGVNLKAGDLARKWLSDRTDHFVVQFFRYFWVGGVAAIADIGVFTALTKVFHLHYLLSNLVGFLVGLLTNYSLSVLWVFSKRTVKSGAAEFGVFAAIGVLGLGLNELILYIVHGRLHYDVILSKVFATGVVFVWNFLGRKLLLFR